MSIKRKKGRENVVKRKHFGQRMSSSFHVIWSCGCFLFLFVIGLPMWLVGCNPDVEGGCLTQEVVNMTLTSKKLISGKCCGSCQSCRTTTNADGKSHQECDTYCCQGHTCWTCDYNFYAPGDKHCSPSCDTIYRTMAEVENDNSVYSLNQTYRMIYDPRVSRCTKPNGSKRVWWTGVVFCCLAACALFIWSICCCIEMEIPQTCNSAIHTFLEEKEKDQPPSLRLSDMKMTKMRVSKESNSSTKKEEHENVDVSVTVHGETTNNMPVNNLVPMPVNPSWTKSSELSSSDFSLPSSSSSSVHCESSCSSSSIHSEPSSSSSSSSTDKMASESLCVICMNRLENKRYMFFPCSHAVLCFKCAQKKEVRALHDCPVCRRRLEEGKIKVVFL